MPIYPKLTPEFIVNTLDDQVTIDLKGNAIHHTTLSYSWGTQSEIYGSSFGREVWAGLFTLSYGETHTITFIWMVPGVSKKDAKDRHYQYVIQRQAGAQWTLHLQITLPSCAVMNNTWGGLVSNNKQIATLSQSLNKDLDVGLDYLC